MGNAVTQCITGGSRGKGNLVILLANGEVLEMRHSMRCEELLKAHPYHFVCHSSSILLMQQGKFVAADAKLRRGEIYFLLPLPGDLEQQGSVDELSDTESLLGRGGFVRPQVHGSIKFVIPKQYLNRIMSEQSTRSGKAVKGRGNGKSGKRRRGGASSSRKHSSIWAPELDSIVERD